MSIVQPINTAQKHELLRRIEEDRATLQSLGDGDAKLIHSCSEFVAEFTTPDYLIDGMMQRRFIYSVTGATGSGKTAVLILISVMVDHGGKIGNRQVAQGQVLYFAGENPDDIRMRLIAMAQHMNFDINESGIHFIAGRYSIPQIRQRVQDEAREIGGVALVIIDTSIAYFDGDAENDNVQAATHARQMRELVNLEGGPTVLVACHPKAGAQRDSLVPRGGSAFLCEVDGNLTCWKSDSVAELHWYGKFRGPDFEPTSFQLLTVNADKLRDSRGRLIPTVIAKPLSRTEEAKLEAATISDEDSVLLTMLDNAEASIQGIAEALGWRTANGDSYKSKVQRVIARLHRHRLVQQERHRWVLTDKGKDAAKEARSNRDLTGAKYG